MRNKTVIEIKILKKLKMYLVIFQLNMRSNGCNSIIFRIETESADSNCLKYFKRASFLFKKYGN